MRVAIIGAGLSGLSCANRLKKYGITPIVFEKKSRVGGALCSACINLRFFSNSVVDPFVYLKNKYDFKSLQASPIFKFNKIYLGHQTCSRVPIYGKIRS